MPQDPIELDIVDEDVEEDEESESSSMTIDETLEKIGGFGRFQLLMTSVAGHAALINGSGALAMVFITQYDAEGVPLPGTVTGEWGGAPSRLSVGICNALFFVGWFIGAWVFGSIADHKGRRFAYASAAILEVFGSIIAIISPNFSFYACTRVISGTGVGGLGLVAWVIAAEFWTPKSRTVVGCLYQCYYAAGIALVSLEAFYIRDWRIIMIITSVPTLLPLLFWPWVSESARWLMVKGRRTEAIKVLKRVARMNMGSACAPPSAFFEGLVCDDVKENRWGELFITPNMRKRSIIMPVSWATVASLYYGISIYAGKLSGSIYVNSAIAALSEWPACVLAIFLVQWGRRSGVSLFLLLAGVGCVLVLVTPGEMETALAITAKFGISGAFTAVYVYSSELFPTTLRSRGTGLCSQSARVGAALAPLIALLGKYGLLLWGAAALIDTFMVLMLPETRGVPLPETIDEVETRGGGVGIAVLGRAILALFRRRRGFVNVDG